MNLLLDKWQNSMINYFKIRFKEVTKTDGVDINGFVTLFPALNQFPKVTDKADSKGSARVIQHSDLFSFVYCRVGVASGGVVSDGRARARIHS